MFYFDNRLLFCENMGGANKVPAPENAICCCLWRQNEKNPSGFRCVEDGQTFNAQENTY